MLRELVLMVCNSDWTPDDGSDYSSDIGSLWTTFAELDEWLSGGGTLPADWASARRPPRST